MEGDGVVEVEDVTVDNVETLDIVVVEVTVPEIVVEDEILVTIDEVAFNFDVS